MKQKGELLKVISLFSAKIYQPEQPIIYQMEVNYDPY